MAKQRLKDGEKILQVQKPPKNHTNMWYNYIKNRPYSNVGTGPFQPCFLLSETVQAVSTVEAEITLKA